MNHAHAHRALLSLAVAVVILIAAVYAFMQYRISFLTERAIEETLAGDTSSNKTQGHQGVAATFQNTITERARLNELFVRDDNAVSFIEAVEAVGTQSGIPVSLSSIVPVSSETGERVGTLQAHVEARGSWQAVMKALMLIELLPYRMSITRVRLDGPAEASATARSWRLSLDIEASQIVSSH